MRYVDITVDGPLETKNEHTKAKIALSGVEVPQADSLEELVSMCGGQDNLLTLGNKLILATPASNVARARIRTAKADENAEERDTAARKVARDYRPEISQARGVPAKEAKNRIDSLKARLEAGETLSQEELVAIIMGTQKVEAPAAVAATA